MCRRERVVVAQAFLVKGRMVLAELVALMGALQLTGAAAGPEGLMGS